MKSIDTFGIIEPTAMNPANYWDELELTEPTESVELMELIEFIEEGFCNVNEAD